MLHIHSYCLLQEWQKRAKEPLKEKLKGNELLVPRLDQVADNANGELVTASSNASVVWNAPLTPLGCIVVSNKGLCWR